MEFLWSSLIDLIIKYIDIFSAYNYVTGIIFSTIIFRAFFFPLNYYNQKNSLMMKMIQPKLKEINKEYNLANNALTKEDLKKRKLLRNEIIKEYGVRPFSLGCLPMLVQIPFYILFIQAIMNHERLIESSFLWLSMDMRDNLLITPIILFMVTYMQLYYSNISKKGIFILIFSLFMGLIGSFLPSSIVIYMITLSLYATIQQLIINFILKFSTSNIGKVSAQ